MKNKKIIFLLTVLLLGAVLTSCGQSSIEIGMVETNLPGEWRANYNTFTGRKTDTFRADEGQTLTLEYDILVEKGELSVRVENPEDQIIWDTSLENGESDTVEIPLEQSGRYAIVFEGEDTGGGWDMSWEIQ